MEDITVDHGDDQRAALTKEIVALEWAMFSTVNNVGGPAACQSQDETFRIMRTAQFSTWSLETLSSYHRDILQAQEQGRNLMTEKYARMMSVTHPDEYAQIESSLPAIPQRAFELVDTIAAQHEMWDKQVAQEFPHLRGRGRTRDEEAQVGATPTANTYLVGELLTYSLPTLECVLHDVETALTNGKNLVRDQLEATVTQYGWPDLQTAEAHQ
ncbi:MAG: DUF4125 family protein [Actinomycetaceae bacterium]|nr:DUF4125 family protein [Arcanobacterium sp.]MDD7686758.1 DUF4125 family protein [Actinomycetaceae bacterium]MDY5272564.1 DUF4125 family protein [Arcanobacterium sp.]